MADPTFATPNRVHVLFGAGFFARVIVSVVQRGLYGTAIMETEVGNIVFGYNGERNDEECKHVATAIEYVP